MPELQNFRGVQQGSFQGHCAVAGGRLSARPLRGDKTQREASLGKKKCFSPQSRFFGETRAAAISGTY